MGKILTNIPESGRTNGRTPDAIKHNKECDDFQCLDDGTITKECNYCNLSLVCQQVDILPNGQTIDMEAHHMPIMDAETGQVFEWELYCTGMHRSTSIMEKPDKVS